MKLYSAFATSGCSEEPTVVISLGVFSTSSKAQEVVDQYTSSHANDTVWGFEGLILIADLDQETETYINE